MSAWMGDEPGAEGLAEWYELAIANDNEVPAEKPKLMWEWMVSIAFIATFWIAVGFLGWTAYCAAARWAL